MSSEGNVWAPGTDEGPREVPPGTPEVTGQLPDVVAVFTEVLEDLRDHFVNYLMAGVGYLVLIFVAVFVAIGVIMVLSIAPAAILGAIGGEEAASVGALLGMTVGYLVVIFGLTVVMAPLGASMARSVKAHLDGVEPLGIGAMFTRAGTDIVQTVLLTALTMVLVLLGTFMCYLPGLLAGLFLGFAFPALIVHRLSAVESMKLSFGHVRDHFTWHLGFFGLGFAILLIAQAVPFIGVMIGMPVYLAYQVRCYERVFGAGEAPITS